MKTEKYVVALKVLILCCLWYASSSSNNIIHKIVLSDFPYPMTLTLVQLISVSLYSGFLLRAWNVKRCNLTKSVYLRLIIPLSIGKFVSSATMQMSILKLSLSYTHTVKATLPFFTVILSRILLGEKHTTAVYCSLVPIVVGVSLSTVTELSFNAAGLSTALLSTLVFTLQNIYSKKCMRDTGIHQFYLLMLLARLAAVCFFPLWLFFDVHQYFTDQQFLLHIGVTKLIYLLLLDGFLNFLQHVFAFSMLALVAPLTYSVANATKRVVIIASSLFVLGNPVTSTNIIGMAAAMVGVLVYQKVKYNEDEAVMRLPHVLSDVGVDKNLLLSSLDHDWPAANSLPPHLANGYTHVSIHANGSLPVSPYRGASLNGSLPASPYQWDSLNHHRGESLNHRSHDTHAHFNV